MEKMTYLIYDKPYDDYYLVKMTETQMKAIKWFLDKADNNCEYTIVNLSIIKLEEI